MVCINVWFNGKTLSICRRMDMKIKEWIEENWIRIVLTIMIGFIIFIVLLAQIYFPCDPSISDCYNCTG